MMQNPGPGDTLHPTLLGMLQYTQLCPLHTRAFQLSAHVAGCSACIQVDAICFEN